MYNKISIKHENEIKQNVVNFFSQKSVFFCAQDTSVGTDIENVYKTEIFKPGERIYLAENTYDPDAVYKKVPIEIKCLKYTVNSGNANGLHLNCWIKTGKDGAMFTPNEMEACKNGVPVIVTEYISYRKRHLIYIIKYFRGIDVYNAYDQGYSLSYFIKNKGETIFKTDPNFINNITAVNCKRSYVSQIIETTTGKVYFRTNADEYGPENIYIVADKQDPYSFKAARYVKEKDSFVRCTESEEIFALHGNITGSYFIETAPVWEVIERPDYKIKNELIDVSLSISRYEQVVSHVDTIMKLYYNNCNTLKGISKLSNPYSWYNDCVRNKKREIKKEIIDYIIERYGNIGAMVFDI